MTDPVAAVNDCEHHYETRLLGGHPLHVRLCTLCRTPDWNDLDEQAAELGAAVLRAAVDVAREEGHRLEAEQGIEVARGARSVAYLLRRRLVKAQPATPDNLEPPAAYREALRRVESSGPRPSATAGPDQCSGCRYVPCGNCQPTPAPADLRQRVAEALMTWAEGNNAPQYASIRRPETVTRNAYGRADAVLAELKRELDALAEYESTIDWETTCTSCARVLNSAIRETERAEKAEAAITRVQDAAALHRQGLLKLSELYAVIAATTDPTPAQAATEATEPAPATKEQP